MLRQLLCSLQLTLLLFSVSTFSEETVGSGSPNTGTDERIPSTYRETKFSLQLDPDSISVNPGRLEPRICPLKMTFGSVEAKYLYGTILSTTLEDSVEDCARRCFSIPLCGSANFNNDLLFCETMAEPRVADLLRDREGYTFVTNFDCERGPVAEIGCGRAFKTPRVTVAGMSMAERFGLDFNRVSEARRLSFPWMVSLMRGTTHICSGVLISDTHVLTSASCFRRSRIPSAYQVVPGVHTLEIIEVDNPRVPNQRTKVVRGAGRSVSPLKEIKIHESYDPTMSNEHDIAIAVLTRPVRFTPNILPVCLPEANTPPDTPYCITAGWGKIGGFSSVMDMQQLPSRILPSDTCNRRDWYGQYSVTDNMICAGHQTPGACQPDVGGPLLCKSNSAYMVYGVSSWGEGCARFKKPQVFTNVAQYREWIAKNTGAKKPPTETE